MIIIAKLAGTPKVMSDVTSTCQLFSVKSLITDKAAMGSRSMKFIFRCRRRQPHDFRMRFLFYPIRRIVCLVKTNNNYLYTLQSTGDNVLSAGGQRCDNDVRCCCSVTDEGAGFSRA